MIRRRSDRDKRALSSRGQPPGTRPRLGLRRVERGRQRSLTRRSAPCVGPKEANVHPRLSPRASLTPSLLLLLFGSFVLVAFSSAGSAGPAEQGSVRHSVQGFAGIPILQVHSTSGKSCQLCHDQGYCIEFEDRSSCEANKLVVEKKWDATLKWTCSCRTKKTKTPSEPDKAACCWVAGNIASKICGSQSKIQRALVISNPGKLIECGAP